MNERPTSAEKADAAHRLADALEEVHKALNKCGDILRERRPIGSYSTGPLFSDGEIIDRCLRQARELLWQAMHPVARQGFTEGRIAAREEAN